MRRSWKNLGQRPPLKEVPTGYSIVGAGVIKSRLTAWRCMACFPNFFKFLLAFAFIDAANGEIVIGPMKAAENSQKRSSAKYTWPVE